MSDEGEESGDIIELLSDDDYDESNAVDNKPAAVKHVVAPNRKQTQISAPEVQSTELQVGVVLEEDLHITEPHAFLQEHYRSAQTQHPPLLYHDPDFESTPASIEGTTQGKRTQKCRCKPSVEVALRYITRGPNKGRPYYGCHKTKAQGGCMQFRWAFQAEKLQWHRFGEHTGHQLVNHLTGFSAQDLVQGRVGDCWFLSALAVIAERPDLIQRLFDCYNPDTLRLGLVQVNLFLDGFWKTVTIDNFLPAIVDEKAENEMQKAINASLGRTTPVHAFQGEGRAPSCSSTDSKTKEDDSTSSMYDPFALSDKNRQVLTNTQNFLDEQQTQPISSTHGKNIVVNPYAKKPPPGFQPPPDATAAYKVPAKLNRAVTTEDLAYSKARHQQLWVPFLEKAYAKSHGCYQAISGGHIAEAFLDLTGAPTEQISLHNQPGFDPKAFWYKLLSWRHQRLPMGCATSQSQAGIIGMHAYSILDVVEIKNVNWEFFRDKLQDRSLGNVSGFVELDGTVRLLRIRNPHGKGEWKGEFSDQSDVWEKLLQHSGTTLERTMQNDGTFWIDYDSFLLGFSNVDVVLSFLGNHARSFETNFPAKKCNQRCSRAFEVCLLEDDACGSSRQDTVELFVMGIQKTRRGAYHGRADRKVSYKICDMGILVGEHGNIRSNEGKDDSSNDLEFASVQGEMFGFRRNGHCRLILNRQKNRRLTVMPISFGHPAATDKDRSFALRFVADAPLLIRELPEVPRMDRVLRSFCFDVQPAFHNHGQRRRRILLEGPTKHGESLYRVLQIDCLANQGGVVFVYLCINDRLRDSADFHLNLSMETTCRGMMCRTESGFLTHETLAKGKKFEASWRKFRHEFRNEGQSRLLMVLVQSGQDSQMGTVSMSELTGVKSPFSGGQPVITAKGELAIKKLPNPAANYEKSGVFTSYQDAEMSPAQQMSAFGPNPIGAAATCRSDLELEHALSLSRGDLEVNEALELSKLDNNSPTSPIIMSEDQALWLALEHSREDRPMDGGAARVDDDLNEAIKRSLEDTKIGGAVDLTESKDNAILQKSAKRIRTKEEVTDIINLAEDSDNDEGVSIPPVVANPIDEEERRRLAAEAADLRLNHEVSVGCSF